MTDKAVTTDSIVPSETAPLLPAASVTTRDISNDIPRRQTPLPKVQLGIVLLVQICEPIMSQSIYPYVNQLIFDLGVSGGDPTRVGFYAGALQSLFFAVQALSVMQWGKASDRVGRKPILMIGLLGASLSMLSFGFSRSFLGLVVSRCICGALNGNVGVMKSVIGDLTDSTNRADAVSTLPMIWAFGATSGALIGGSLSYPVVQFPDVFRNKVWELYPHLLPCIVVAAVSMLAWIIIATFFHETVPSAWRLRFPFRKGPIQGNRESLSQLTALSGPRQDVSLKDLLTFPVLISSGNYVALALIDIFNLALLPLFCYSDVENGGLGLPPNSIGKVMAVYGISVGLLQFFFFSRVLRALGERTLFLCSISMFAVLYILYSLTSIVVRKFGFGIIVYVLVGVMLLTMAVADMAYSSFLPTSSERVFWNSRPFLYLYICSVFMFVTSSPPNKRVLGATFGLSQTAVSVIRAIGPATATSLFSLSLSHNILGGHFVYVVGLIMSVFSFGLGMQLPSKVWDEPSD
ncbi:major facilitator superfamily domain-containing protein [Flagelloscypha sp. PMI_526]|nr:major facilitator superfamily domain-containing protein [Flagelloscypha sp. PMI_526]